MQNECKTRAIARTWTKLRLAKTRGRDRRRYFASSKYTSVLSVGRYRRRIARNFFVLPARTSLPPCNNSGNHPTRWQEWIEYVTDTEYRAPPIKCAVSRKISHNGRARRYSSDTSRKVEQGSTKVLPLHPRRFSIYPGRNPDPESIRGFRWN